MAKEASGLSVAQLGYAVRQRTLLEGVEFTLAPGEVLGVLGPNGAGKSTLLKLLAGQWQPGAGQICWLGRSLSDWTPGEMARYRAVMPQQFATPFDFTAQEIVLMGRLPFRDGTRQLAMAHRAMEWTECRHLSGQVARSLSGGELQRVNFARVLMQLSLGELPHPGLLLLDEPVSSLDPAHQYRTLELCRKMAACGCAVLVILHDLNLAADYCDRLLLLQSGRLVASGAPHEVLSEERLREVFHLRSASVENDLTGGRSLIFAPITGSIG